MASNFWNQHFCSVYIPAVELFITVLLERVLPQFSALEDEAKKVEEREYQRLGQLPGDENVDMAELAEQAEDFAVMWYQNMMAIRQSLVNLHAVGLRHLFEQQLYDFVKHARLSNRNSAKYKNDCEALNKIGINVELLSSWPTLEELRFLCNCVKHAEGSGANELKKKKPDLFIHPSAINLPFLNQPGPIVQPLAGEDVYVSPEDLAQYVDAIKAFWTEVATYTEGLP